MAKTRQAGQQGRARRWLAWGSLGLALSLTTGCSGAQHATAPPADPLFGVRTPPGMALPTDTPKTAGGAPTAPQAFAPGGVPAVPTSNQAANTATLAGNGWKGPLGQPTPLTDHHSGPPLLPGRGTIGTQTPQVPAPPPNANPKVEQVPDAPAPGAAVMPTASWDVKPSVAPASTPGQTTAAEILLKKLQDRGVVNQKQDLTPEGIHLTCYIPRETGGLRILEATAEALQLPAGALDASWACLRRTGNLSSASVLLVLEEFLLHRRQPAGSYSLMAAMGPGFCSELLLLQW